MLLVRTPRPRATESLFGFVLRVSEANGYESPRHVWGSADLPRGSELAPTFPTEALAAILGVDAAMLQPLAYRESQAAPGAFKLLSRSLLNGVRSGLLRLRRPALCPSCIRETGYIDAFWDLEAAVACPVHGTEALSVCPACRRSITWLRPGLLTCVCGAQLEDSCSASMPAAVIELMRLIDAKLHGRAIEPEMFHCGLPLAHLIRLSFAALLHIVLRVGSINTAPAHDGTESSALPAVRAAGILAEWPHGFHRFLRALGESSLERGTPTSGIRKQFADFYETVFKNRSISRADSSFLRDEFIEFGLQHWGKGVVDPRMLRDKNALESARFISRTELAKRHRLWKPTVRKMRDQGTLAGTEIAMKGAVRAVIDAQCSTVPLPSTQILNVRAAAKRLGLPVRVLVRLREQGVYRTEMRCGYSSSWYAEEVEQFRSRLLALAPASPLDAACGTVTLKEIARRGATPVNTRSAIVAALLSGALTASACAADGPGDLLLDKQIVDAFVRRHSQSALGPTCSFKECSATTGLCPTAIPQAIGTGHLVQVVVAGHKRISAESAERFRSDYAALAVIAHEHRVSPRLLLRLCRDLELPVLLIARAYHESAQGFIARSLAPRLTEILSERAARREQARQRTAATALHEERLRAYCERVIESGRGLPRRAGIPIKRLIADECRFDRDAFYAHPRLQGLLDEYDRKERERDEGRCQRPAEALRRYLARIRQVGDSLPLWNGRPNVLRIAKQCGIHRHAIERDPDLLKMLETFRRPDPSICSGEPGTAPPAASP